MIHTSSHSPNNVMRITDSINAIYLLSCLFAPDAAKVLGAASILLTWLTKPDSSSPHSLPHASLTCPPCSDSRLLTHLKHSRVVWYGCPISHSPGQSKRPSSPARLMIFLRWGFAKQGHPTIRDERELSYDRFTIPWGSNTLELTVFFHAWALITC